MNEARGYLGVLHNRNFLALWVAQIVSLLALNSSLFVALFLIENATQSTAQDAAVIAAFSLPAVFLAAIAGIIVDRVSKKDMLVVSNGLRVISQLLLALFAAWGLTRQINTAIFVAFTYVIIFFSSAVGQFFAPAEGSTIPLLVGREGLFAANSLFTLTVVATQVAAVIVVVPITIKTLGIVYTLLLLAAFYVVATILVSLLPRDPAPVRRALSARSVAKQAWTDLAEGWWFSLSRPPILLGILQISLVTALVYVVAAIGPGYAARVLGLATEDAIFVFSPAGAGILIASLLVVRYGQHLARHSLPIAGTILMGATFFALGLVGVLGGSTQAPVFHLHPDLAVSATTLIAIVSIFAGVALALILIPAQTAVQEGALDENRGRVLTVQFTLANALGVLPLLTIGGLADLFGIPNVTIGVGLSLVVIAILNFFFARGLTQQAHSRVVGQALPFPGSDPMPMLSSDDGHGQKATRDSHPVK
jgi:Major Facilitator Superfamily